MVTVLGEGEEVRVPAWVRDIDAFRRWHQEDVPDHWRAWWLRGEVWVDMSREQLFTHNLLKTKIAFTLTGLAMADGFGWYFGDGILLSSFEANVSGRPDGTFLLAATAASDRVRLIEGKQEGFVELQGTPDMVLEVVSPASVHKDTVLLREAYWQAGIPEYWLVDARGEGLRFDLLRRAARGYSPARNSNGWLRSAVFGTSFRLRSFPGLGGHPDYALDVR